MENHLHQLDIAKIAAESAIEQSKTALMIMQCKHSKVRSILCSIVSARSWRLAVTVESAVDTDPKPYPKPSKDAVTLYDEYDEGIVEEHQKNIPYYQIIEKQGQPRVKP